MYKFKIALLIFFTIALIVLGLFVPWFTTQALDSSSADAVYIRDMATTPQNPSSPEDTVPRGDYTPGQEDPVDNMMWKLSFLDKVNLVPVTSQLSSRTTEEVLELAEEKRSLYAEVLGCNADLAWYDATLYLSVDPYDPSSYFLVWWISYNHTLKDGSFYTWDIIMDDETGKVMNISYRAYPSHWNNEDLDGIMEILTAMYFSELGLNGEQYFTHQDKTLNNIITISRYYTLPPRENVETQLVFELDTLYFSVYLTRYQVEEILP